jgi:hypothetical protein
MTNSKVSAVIDLLTIHRTFYDHRDHPELLI